MLIKENKKSDTVNCERIKTIQYNYNFLYVAYNYKNNPPWGYGADLGTYDHLTKG